MADTIYSWLEMYRVGSAGERPSVVWNFSYVLHSQLRSLLLAGVGSGCGAGEKGSEQLRYNGPVHNQHLGPKRAHREHGLLRILA